MNKYPALQWKSTVAHFDQCMVMCCVELLLCVRETTLLDALFPEHNLLAAMRRRNPEGPENIKRQLSSLIAEYIAANNNLPAF